MLPAPVPFLAVVFVATWILAIGTTRFSLWLSHRLDILDRPDPRKAHREPIAYLGGLGMLLAVLAGLLLIPALQPELAVFEHRTLLILLGGALAIYSVGFWDDVRPLPAFLKLGLQIVVASAMWWAGVRVELLSFGGASAPVEVAAFVSWTITVGWYVALMNSINLVDGLDGLAGGISFLGALSLIGVGIVLGASREVLLSSALCAVIAGATLGFLWYNWHPARIFMGDGGALLLGFLLASASLVGSTKTPTLLTLTIPLVALGLPLFESGFSFLRRALKLQHPFKPDRRHLHHRLLDLGLDQRRVVLFLHFMTAFLGLNSVLLAAAGSRLLLLNVALLIAGLILLIENLKYLEARRNAGQSQG